MVVRKGVMVVRKGVMVKKRMRTPLIRTKHLEETALQQIGFSSNDHDADAQHGEDDIDNLTGLRLRNEDVVNQRREDKSDKRNRQAADQTHDHLEEGTNHRNHGHQNGHKDTQSNAVRVLHEHSVLRLRYTSAPHSSPTLLDAALQSQDAGEHGNRVGEVRDETNTDAADNVHHTLGVDVRDDQRLDAVYNSPLPPSPTRVHRVAHRAQHAQRHVHQYRDDDGGDQREGVLLRLLHGVVGGGSDHRHAQRVADHAEELREVQRSVPEEVGVVDVQAVLEHAVASDEGRRGRSHDHNQGDGNDENVAQHGRLGQGPTVNGEYNDNFKSLRRARGMARTQ